MTSIEDLQVLITDHHRWAESTFAGETSQEKILKLKKEADEVAADPTDLVEYADVGLLLLQILTRHGFTVEQWATAMENKSRINRTRQWQKQSDGTYSTCNA